MTAANMLELVVLEHLEGSLEVNLADRRVKVCRNAARRAHLFGNHDRKIVAPSLVCLEHSFEQINALFPAGQ